MAQLTVRTPYQKHTLEHYRKQPFKSTGRLRWIEVAPNVPYFKTDTGSSWTPIGQNDAITWPDLQGAFRRKDMARVEAYLQMLAQHGVTCLRLMLEYCHGEHRFFENPIGYFPLNMVRLWDDLFLLCEKYGLRILLTPYDTFWMWLRWSKHPYKKTNGGPCEKRNQWLLCSTTRAAIKKRLAFATERWGSSGALFAWDIWNEIHPAHAGNSVSHFSEFIEDISSFLRYTELRLHGRAHPQTVSVFGPVLQKEPAAAACIFKHPSLNFASVHFYEGHTIDNPKNTIDAAISTGRLTREALAHIDNSRPFFDSEHGPIHTFKDRKRTLPEPFDDEYFRHMQWAHFASGGAGGGMRWPNRHPHTLTAGMRNAQKALARFLPLIDWQQFQRRNLNKEIEISNKAISVFSCGDSRQAILWLLRTDTLNKKGMLYQHADALTTCAHIPGLQQGRYRVTLWDTNKGCSLHAYEVTHSSENHLCVQVPNIITDVAVAVKRSDV